MCMHVGENVNACRRECMHVGGVDVCVCMCEGENVYICIRMYVCVWERMYVCVRTCVHVCRRMCMHVCARACGNVCACVCTHACEGENVCVRESGRELLAAKERMLVTQRTTVHSVQPRAPFLWDYRPGLWP